MQVIKYRGENMNFKELNQMVVNSYEFNTPDYDPYEGRDRLSFMDGDMEGWTPYIDKEIKELNKTLSELYEKESLCQLYDFYANDEDKKAYNIYINGAINLLQKRRDMLLEISEDLKK